MIAKCIAVLAVVAQINASGCGCGISPVVMPTVDSSALSSPAVYVPSGNPGLGHSGSVTRNLVGQGKYPVALKNCGPVPDNQIPVTTSRVTAPVQEKPTVRLPANIPAPRVLSHSCTCYKTIVRPRVHQQLITVPSVQRYVETTHKPVVENIQYEAVPVSCGSSASGLQFFQAGPATSTSSPVELVSNFVPQVQSVDIPTVQLPQIQPVQLPQIQPVQLPQIQPVQLPQIQPVQLPQIQPVQLPQIQSVQLPQIQPVQTIEVPQVQSLQLSQPSFGSCSCHC